MEITKEQFNELVKLNNALQLVNKKINTEVDLLIMQSKALRELSVEMTNHIAEIEDMSPTDFDYWMRKSEEYMAQSVGLAAIRDMRISLITKNTQRLAGECEKYGIKIDEENINTLIQGLESDNN
jgi:C-terminal processing protease CtpA/Prc